MSTLIKDFGIAKTEERKDNESMAKIAEVTITDGQGVFPGDLQAFKSLGGIVEDVTVRAKGKDGRGNRFPQHSVTLHIDFDVPASRLAEIVARATMKDFIRKAALSPNGELETMANSDNVVIKVSSISKRKPRAPKEHSREDLLAVLAANPELLAEAQAAQSTQGPPQ